jgi:ribosomal protein L24E
MTCEYCGRQLEKLVFGTSRLRKNKRFCDALCGERARRRGQRAAEKPKSCLFCGEMLPPPQGFGRIPTYCNAKCRKGASRMGRGTVKGDMPAEMIEKLIESNYQRIQLERRRTGAA